MTNDKDKSLYQIAIERILGRLTKAPAGVKNEVIFLVERSCRVGLTADERAGAVDYMVRNLFPELFHDSSDSSKGTK